MSRSVTNGTLVQASPSSIESFDANSPFGCNLKWWYKYVKGLKDTGSFATSQGTELHKEIEEYILSKALESALASPIVTTTLFQAIKPLVDSVIREDGIVAVERNFEMPFDGVKLVGKIDVLTGKSKLFVKGVLDWKTTKSILKYAKTPEQLETDTQMLLYANYVHEVLGAPLPILVSQVFVQTEGTIIACRRDGVITQARLDAGKKRITSLLSEMKRVAAATEAHDVEGVRNWKCKRCPYKEQCDKDSQEMTSIMDDFSILPPDAPTSNPPKADADSVSLADSDTAPTNPGGSAITASEPAKKGRGRPRGALNKPAFTEPSANPVRFTACTVSRGITIPTVQFGGERIDVSFTVTGEDTAEELFAKANSQAETLLKDEARKVLAAVKAAQERAK